MTQVDNIQIVKYEPHFAASIADMWNASHESWGGDNTVQTEQMILKEHHHHTHIDIFLAVAGNEVVGYCSFSHYKEDAGALYIPLLNVRPDYHGHKIGKRLVLRAVEETIKLGWARLDLYTWAGNVKAVPTYKKAGFFWERRDDTTHLINLIPSVVQTPAVQHYFEQLDWYADSIREIMTEPDGREEYGFDYFTYTWSKDDLQLKMEYERTGRGLRLIETNDYLIQAKIPVAHRLPFGTRYPIVYEVINKTGQPLSIEINSVSNDAISFELHESKVVESREIIEGYFNIAPIEEAQDPFQTHPVVEAQLLINGQAATFKIGIEPKFPVRLKLQAPHQTLYTNEKVELELTVDNEYDTEVTYYLECPSDDVLSFEYSIIEIQVPAKSRSSVSLKANLLSYGIWHHQVKIYNNSNRNEDSKVLEQYISLVFPGIQSTFGGETAEDWVIANGKYNIRLNKISNHIAVYDGLEKRIDLFYPKFGLPYNNEFQKVRASNVIFREDDAMILEAQYDLHSLDVLLTTVVKVYRNGIVNRYHMVQNQQKEERTEPLFLKEHFNFQLENSIIPYRNHYIDTAKGPDASASDYWEVSDLTENWLFSNKKGSTYGITWSPDRALVGDHWRYALEHPLHMTVLGDTVETPAVQLAIGTWSDWQDFRAFALNTHSEKTLTTSAPLEIKFNQGNPFVRQSVDVQIIERKNTILYGILSLDSQQKSMEHTEQSLDKELELHEYSLQLPVQADHEVDIVTVQLDMDAYVLEQSHVVFPVSAPSVTQQVLSTEHGDIHHVHNGVIEFQASETFAPSLFSLKYHGVEWLHSSFPQLGAKSWWNPWIGGMYIEIGGLSGASLMAEERSVQFTELKDNKGNLWSGICVTVNIQKNVKLRGLSVQQYYLTLSGVPVLTTFIKLDQQTGTSLTPFSANHFNFYQVSEDIQHTRAYLQNMAGEKVVYKAGKVQYESEVTNKIIRYGSSKRKQKLTFIANPQTEYCAAFLNTDLSASVVTEQMFVNHNQQVWGKPQFHLISEVDIPDEALVDLFNIQFDITDPEGSSS